MSTAIFGPTWSLQPSASGSIDSARWGDSLRRFLERVGARLQAALRRGWFDYAQMCVKQRVAHFVPPGSRVLDIGCGDGDLLAHLQPAHGVGVDFNWCAIQIASKNHPNLQFQNLRAEEITQLGETFDYIVVVHVLDEIYDLRKLFLALQSVCHSRTRIILVTPNRLWRPVLRILEFLRLKAPAAQRNRLPQDEIEHLLDLCDFQSIRRFSMTIAPLYVPALSALLNKFVATLPGVRRCGLNDVVVARSISPSVLATREFQSVSIIVPVRNEGGHIQQLLDRLPVFAPKQELIFVEGNSTDDTWTSIHRAVSAYRGPMTIRTFRQDGKGKGDAIRKGFAHAAGDVLMTLDADMSVPPEELSTLYEALVRGHGEFINGSRMVYHMGRKSPPFLSLLAMKLFGWLLPFLLSQRIGDALCGTKALARSDYQRIGANQAHCGAFDPDGDCDLLFAAAGANLKIVDLPVHCISRTCGEMNVPSRRQSRWLLGLVAAAKLKFV